MDSASDDDVEDRRSRLRRLVWADPSGAVPLGVALERVCLAAVAELRLWGAAVTVMPSTSSHPVAAASSDAVRVLEEAQFGTGDGPSGDANRGSSVVLASGVDGESLDRWPGFRDAAARAGVCAAFAFPLHLGAARLGSLSLYRGEPGRLTRPQLTSAYVLADIAVEILVDGSLPRNDGAVGTTISQALDGQAHVFQAQGMVMVQLGVALPEALARMRAYAYARDLTLATLATEIVAGRTRITKE